MTNTKETNEFNYGDCHVKYDMEALNNAIDHLEYDEDGICYATGLMLDGNDSIECHIAVHNTDDWEDLGDDVLHISSSEIILHTIPNNGDTFIITSIGGYEAEISDLVPEPVKNEGNEKSKKTKKPKKTKTAKKFKTIPLWVRAGMTWNVTPDELKIVLGDDYEAIGKLFAEAVKTGKAVLDGETYIPDTIFDMLDEDDPLKVHLNDDERDELGEKSWDVYPD